MKHLLVVAPDHVGIIEVMLQGFADHPGYTVDFIDLKTPRFQYKNFAQRTLNFYLKNFKGRNLKNIHHQEVVAERIRSCRPAYDTVFIIRPDLANDENLALLRGLTRNFIAYYWDTVAFFPRKLDIRHFFDHIFSFDTEDCRNYGFELLTNFYFFEKDATEVKYQVYNLTTYDDRFAFLEQIAARLEQLNLSYYFKAYRGRKFSSGYITHFSEIVKYREMLEEIAASDVLLEVQKEAQSGLTFRPFEALGLNKKLITTNKNIEQYDFYQPENILVINKQKADIPRSFFETPYKEVPPGIKEKYSLRSWVNKVLSVKTP
jgi:hypothetical protein